jgi:hypothetical protein
VWDKDWGTYQLSTEHRTLETVNIKFWRLCIWL